MSKPYLLRIVPNPTPHFEALEYGVADAFEDFLNEKIGLEFVTDFIDSDGKFVARRYFPSAPIPIDEMQTIADKFNKYILRLDLKEIVAIGRFTTKEAKQLLGYDWRSLTSELPTAVRQEAEVLYHQIMGSIEEVEEGYVDDSNDPDMLKRIIDFLKKLSP